MNRKEEFYDSLIILDTEATSKAPKEAEVIEFAAHFPKFELDSTGLYNTRDGDIPYEVQAITHITPDMIQGEELFEDAAEKIGKLLNELPVLVAQNIWYDKTLLEQYGINHPTWLCTMRLAKRLFLEDETFTQFNLSYLRYRLHVKLPSATETHRALADVKVTHGVLIKLVEEMESRELLDDESPWSEQIIEFINQPLKILKMPFGKHKGELLVDVPLSYWKWAMKNLDSLDEDNDNYDADFADSVAEAIEKQM